MSGEKKAKLMTFHVAFSTSFFKGEVASHWVTTAVWFCLFPNRLSVGRSHCRCPHHYHRLCFRSRRPPRSLFRPAQIRSRNAGSSDVTERWTDATVGRSSRLRREPTLRSNVRNNTQLMGEPGGCGTLTSQCLH